MLGKWLAIEGITPQFALWLHFPLPDLQSKYKSNPLAYIGYVLSYGGVNSLTNTLRDTMGLASSITISGQSTSAGHDYFLVVQLTLKGRMHYDVIIDVIFQVVLFKGEDTTLFIGVGILFPIAPLPLSKI